LPVSLRFNFKNLNITAVANGLNSSTVNANLFAGLGPVKNVVQIPGIAVIDFEKYNVLVHPDGKRVVVTDMTGEASLASPISTMMSQIISAMPDINITALGFNYSYELLVQGSTTEFLESYLVLTRFQSLGNLQTGGFKISNQWKDRILHVSVDPVHNQSSLFSLLINHHFDGERDWLSILTQFKELTTEAQELQKKIFQ